MYRLICTLLVAALAVGGCSSESTVSSTCSSATPAAEPAAAVSPPDPPRLTAGTAAGPIPNGDTVFDAGWPGPPAQGPIPAPDSDRQVILPSTLYMVAGQTYRLDYADIVSGFDPRGDVVEAEPPGADRKSFWQYTPENAGSFNLAITVKDGAGATVAAASRPVTVLAAATGHNLRHLSIGDSITRAGGYVEDAVQCVLGGKTVGTRTYDGGIVSEEGRGGWTLERYDSRIGQPQGGDSPFLFPVGVAGAKYQGNTAFWREVVAGDPGGYDYDGFQMIARGWRSTGPYAYDPNGYPATPADGDVVVDPSMPVGTQWRKYQGSTWMTMNPQPEAEFSFTKYIDRFAPAFSAGKPTSISIMLGTVDFLSALTDASWSAYKTRMDRFISAIRAWNPRVPIILIGSPSGGPASMWADQKVTGPEFDQRIRDHNRRLLAAYDTQAARDNGVYVISFLGAVADENMADYVHPRMPEGHAQMSPWLAGMLANLLAEGKV